LKDQWCGGRHCFAKDGTFDSVAEDIVTAIASFWMEVDGNSD